MLVAREVHSLFENAANVSVPSGDHRVRSAGETRFPSQHTLRRIASDAMRGQHGAVMALRWEIHSGRPALRNPSMNRSNSTVSKYASSRRISLIVA